MTVARNLTADEHVKTTCQTSRAGKEPVSRNPRSTGLDIPGFRTVLEKTRSAGVAVEEVADELGMVHVVLGKEIAQRLAPGSDGASALARIALLESKLVQAAIELAEVHAALASQSAAIPWSNHSDQSGLHPKA